MEQCPARSLSKSPEMNLPTCCFCDRPVLEIVGLRESLTLDQIKPSDRELTEVGAVGQAHATCLLQSGRGPAWAQRRYEFMKGLSGITDLGHGPDAAAIYNENEDEYSLYWDNGYSIHVRSQALKLAKKTAQGALVPADIEYNMEIVGRGDLLDEMRQALESDGRYPLDHFLGRLKLTRLVLFSETLRDSYFAFDEQLYKLWEGQWVSCRLVYHIFLPDSGLHLLANFGVRLASELLKVEVAPKVEVKILLPKVDTQLGLAQCCFCKQPVLQLEGQFAELNETMLRPDDFPLRKAGAVGIAHTSCLRRTGLGYPWSLRLFEHTQKTRGFKQTGGLRNAQALWDPDTGKSHLLWEDGLTLCVGMEEATAYGIVGPGGGKWNKLLPRLDLLELDLAEEPSLAHKLRQALSDFGSYSLWELVKDLGIADRMLYPKETLKDGVIQLESEQANIFRLVVDYLILIPYDGVELVALGGYPVTDAEEILKKNPHLRLQLKKREAPLDIKSEDVLLHFLACYEASDSSLNAAFRTFADFLDPCRNGDPSFYVQSQEWHIDQDLHKVYRLEPRDLTPVEEFRTDHFLQSLLQGLPKPRPPI
jgi:hypothetical protein